MKDKLLNSLPVRAAKRFGEAKGPNWATIIAFNMLTAFFPILLVTVTVLTLVLFGHGDVKATIVNFFPDNYRSDIDGVFTTVKTGSGIAAVISVVGLLWSGSGLIGAFDQGLNSLFPTQPRPFIKQKLISFVMILFFSVLVIPLFASSALVSALSSLSFIPEALRGPLGPVLQLGFGVLDCFIIFAGLFYVIPTRKQRLRQVLPGALVAGAAMELFTLIFPVYFSLAGKGFSKFGATFALFFLLMFYFNIIGMISMFGAAFNAEIELAGQEMPQQAQSELGGGLAIAETQGADPGNPADPDATAREKRGDKRRLEGRPATSTMTHDQRARSAGVGVAVLAGAAALVEIARGRRST